jgi:hypothetical protein
MTSPFRWVLTAFRDLGLNVFGFLLMFAGAALLGVGVRTGMETLVERGHLWLAPVFVVVPAGVWATLFGLVRKRHLRNPEGKILPLSAAGFLLGAAAVWVYVFAGLSYALMRLGFVEYALPPRPDDLLAHLTDAYSWHFLDLLPASASTARSDGSARSTSREAAAGRCSCCSGSRCSTRSSPRGGRS